MAPIVFNGVDLANPLANPLIAYNCVDYPGWYCDPRLAGLTARYSEAATPEAARALADELQATVHDAVTFVPGGQFSGPPAWRAELRGVVPFSFPVFWGVERR